MKTWQRSAKGPPDPLYRYLRDPTGSTAIDVAVIHALAKLDKPEH